MRKAIGALCFGACLGCVGSVDDSTNADNRSNGQTPSAPAGAEAAPGATGQPREKAPSAVPPGAAFVDVADRFALLPFAVRLNRLAQLVGVSVDDPMFATLKRKRFELGDYDFGQGIAPDLRWSSRRMSVWMLAVTPVCKSAAMRKRYPSIRARLDDFVLAAYGRPATAEDSADYDAALANAGLDDETGYTTMCIGLLSSTEFVAQ